jgi:hypothetical protein
MKTACPFCGGEIEAGLSTCPFCNENLLRHAQPGTPTVKAPPPTLPPAPVPSGSARRPCPFCAESIGVDDRNCRWCGADTTRPVPGPAAPPMPARRFVEWELPGWGLWSRWWHTTTGALTGMDNFWSRVPWTGGHASPIRYVLFTASLLMAVNLVCNLPFLALSVMGEMMDKGGGVGGSNSPSAAFMVIGIVVFLILAIPLTLVGTYISALIHHLCVLLVGGRGPFETTFRGIAYSFGTAAVHSIPCVGFPISFVFHFLALTHAFAHGHGISKGRAFVAVLLPFLVCCGGAIAAYVVVIAAAIASQGAR